MPTELRASLNPILDAFQRYPTLEKTVAIALLAVIAWLAGRIARHVLTRWVKRAVERTDFVWDDALADRKVFSRLAHLVPAVLTYYGIGLINLTLGDTNTTTAFDGFVQNAKSVAAAYAVLMVVLAISALLSAVKDIYEKRPDAQNKPIKGYVQVAQIVLYVLGGVLVVATLIGKSPGVLLGGLGAMTAVLLIVFKDTILSLVASVQLNSNDMVRVGDWVEMPSHRVDGDVIDIALHTVKVQNFDNTVTTVPTYAFITDAFKNWRAMHESGGRRVKRPLYFDMTSIRFLSDAEIDRLKRFQLLEDYLAAKRQELEEANATISDSEHSPQARRLTNIGTFRAYAASYLSHHPQVNGDLTILVRQLDPTPAGLPMQFYFFTATTKWAEYEGIQSDIFDHFLAIASEFDLRIFQQPAGTDLERLADRGSS